MIKLWGVGNLVMIIPLIRAVRRRFPDARIHFLTLESNADLLTPLPEIDDVITLKTGSVLVTLANLLTLPLRLRALRSDLVLDFEQFLRITPILSFLSGAPQRVGLQTPGQYRASLYQIRVPYRTDRHMTLIFGDVIRSAGVSAAGLPRLEVPRNLAAAAAIEKRLEGITPPADPHASPSASPSPLVVIHPGSGDNFPSRRWPVERFAALAARVQRERNARVVVTGTSPEKALVREFAEHCSTPFTSLVGELKLMEFVELLARADLLVTNDTAPVHITSALQRPLIAIYGPNTPDLYGPLHDTARVFYLNFPCSPCITNLNAKTSSCQIPSCILDIDGDWVTAAALDMLRPAEQDSFPDEAAWQ